jgi:hypothetical protein
MKRIYEITLTNFKNDKVINANVDYTDMQYIATEWELVHTINNKIVLEEERQYLVIIDKENNKSIYISYEFLKDCILITKKS